MNRSSSDPDAPEPSSESVSSTSRRRRLLAAVGGVVAVVVELTTGVAQNGVSKIWDHFFPPPSGLAVIEGRGSRR
ncbi:hypothetical protein ACIQI8_17540 [Streptomyces sp. NPDC092369]|uniref:hypothetical protein n=1 Tax=Streptomyces sp. NPDC092369 TaxID=3366015 RepID=UPI00382199D5